MHPCSEVERLRAEVWDWREEEQQSAGHEPVDGEEHLEVERYIWKPYNANKWLGISRRLREKWYCVEKSMALE